MKESDLSGSTTHRSDKEYIDPNMAVTLDEVQRQRRVDSAKAGFTDQVTYLDPNSNPASTFYNFESSGSWIVGHSRGRSPVSSRRRRSSPYGQTGTSVTSLSLSPDRRSGRSAKVYCDDMEDEVSYPTQLDPQDLITNSESSFPTRHSPSPANKRVARSQRHRSPGFGPPLHQDSGFDEQMLADLRVNEAETSSSEQPTDPEEEDDDSDDEAPQLPQVYARPKPSHGALAAANLAFAR
jgi:hypothetical protein